MPPGCVPDPVPAAGEPSQRARRRVERGNYHGVRYNAEHASNIPYRERKVYLSRREGGLNLPQIRLSDLWILAQFFGGGGVDDLPRLQDVAAGGDLEGDVGVLLDEEDSGPLLVYLADDLEDALHEDGREAHPGLVEEQQLGLRGQGAGYLEAPLIPVGQVLGERLTLADTDEVEKLGGAFARLQLLAPRLL